jgi:hydrogenase 3 maturation protease
MAMPEDMTREWKALAGGNVVFVGIGNEMRGDDGAGPVIIRRIRDRAGRPCIDAGVAPENHLEKILSFSPSTVVLFDAVHLDEKAGAVRIMDALRLPELPGLSTHCLSLSMLCDYLKTRGVTSIFLVGIQPASVSFNAPLSREVALAIESLSFRVAEAFGHA